MDQPPPLPVPRFRLPAAAWISLSLVVALSLASLLFRLIRDSATAYDVGYACGTAVASVN